MLVDRMKTSRTVKELNLGIEKVEATLPSAKNDFDSVAKPASRVQAKSPSPK